MYRTMGSARASVRPTPANVASRHPGRDTREDTSSLASQPLGPDANVRPTATPDPLIRTAPKVKKPKSDASGEASLVFSTTPHAAPTTMKKNCSDVVSSADTQSGNAIVNGLSATGTESRKLVARPIVPKVPPSARGE
jgi:hypothetical protein